MTEEFEQQELRYRWAVDDAPISSSTVRNIVKYSGVEPLRFRGLVPIFSSTQADRMWKTWQRRLKKSRAALSRKMKRIRSEQNGHTNGKAKQ